MLMTKFTPKQQNYLDDQMKKVSRSFALVVGYLEEPLREQLTAAYLICRVVDNIEDCTEPFDWQQHRFAEFNTLLEDPAATNDVLDSWSQYEWPGLTSDEQKLMSPRHGRMLWDIYNQLPEQPRAIIHHWTADMAEGMDRFEDPETSPLLVKRDGVRVLESADDYNRYCYYVAGTVGHMATDLAVANYGFTAETAAALKATCEACGRGLQKTNIIKDFAKDVARGISYVPYEWLASVNYAPLSLAGAGLAWKERVLADVFGELREATRYVLALPNDAVGYRIASLLCLFPAYQTLLQAAERQAHLFTGKHRVKISRKTMVNCIRDARKMFGDNAGILAYSHAAEEQFSAIFNAAQY